MKYVSLESVLQNPKPWMEKILAWAMFIYPTDTIYWIWWIINLDMISRINSFKNRPNSKSFSIIAPSYDRVDTHCQCEKPFATIWSKMKEQYAPNRGMTLITPIRKENSNYFSWLSQTQTIWIRILDHPFQAIVEILWEPIITTSANISGEKSISSFEDLSQDQRNSIDFFIWQWVIDWEWSIIIDTQTWSIVRQ